MCSRGQEAPKCCLTQQKGPNTQPSNRMRNLAIKSNFLKLVERCTEGRPGVRGHHIRKPALGLQARFFARAEETSFWGTTFANATETENVLLVTPRAPTTLNCIPKSAIPKQLPANGSTLLVHCEKCHQCWKVTVSKFHLHRSGTCICF